jgi:hypothetical protein
MHNRQAITPRKFIRTLLDYDMWPLYIMALLCYLPYGPPFAYLTLTLKSIGFDTFQTNLLTIPQSVGTTLQVLELIADLLTFTQLLFWTWISEKWKGNYRIWICILAQLWGLPFLIVLETLSNEKIPWVRFTILTLLLVYPYIQAIQVSLASRNANTVRTRTVAPAIVNMCNQLGSIITSNIYQADDTPYYKRGNKILIGLLCLNIVMYLLTKLYYFCRNYFREKKWSEMGTDEQANYLATTKDKGNKKMDFRFAH